MNGVSLIVGGYRNGRALPFRENLQEICKEIHDGLEVGLKPGISSAAKYRGHMLPRCSLRDPATIASGRPLGVQ